MPLIYVMLAVMVVRERVDRHDRRDPEAADDLDVLPQVGRAGQYFVGPLLAEFGR